MQAQLRADAISPRLTTELASTFRSAIEQAGLPLRDRLPRRCRSRSMSIATCGRRSSSTCSPTRSSSPSQARSVLQVRPSADGAMAELVVRDTGTGIPAHELPHLFERFHRVDGRQGPNLRRQRHRPRPGPGAGQAARRIDPRRKRARRRAAPLPSRVPFGTAHLPSDRLGGTGSGFGGNPRPGLCRGGAELAASRRTRRAAGGGAFALRIGRSGRRSRRLPGLPARACCWPMTTPICATTSAAC